MAVSHVKGPSPQHYLECHYFQEAEDSDSVSSPPHMPASATLSLYAVSSSPGTCSSGEFQAKRCLWFCTSGARLDGKGLVRVRQPILLAHVKGHFYRAWNPHIARIALPERMWLLTAESSRVPDPKESQGTPKPLKPPRIHAIPAQFMHYFNLYPPYCAGTSGRPIRKH